METRNACIVLKIVVSLIIYLSYVGKIDDNDRRRQTAWGTPIVSR